MVDQKRLIVAIAISIAILFVFEIFWNQPIREAGGWGILKPGTSVNGLAPLFPRVEQSV